MPKEKFLLLTNKKDLTTDFIIRELRKRNLEYIRINTEDITSSSVIVDIQTDNIRICRNCHFFDTNTIKAAYFRRPEQPQINKAISDLSDRDYALVEWNALLKAMYLALDGRWFSHPNAILLAEDKPKQLKLALELGFSVPVTIVTNDIKAIRDFLTEGPAIGKPLKRSLLEAGDGGRVIFTTRISDNDISDENSFQAAPIIVQREIPKNCDLRVTVVGESVFPVAIYSQALDETKVDWRKGTHVELVHEVVTIPNNIATACIEFVKRQNLKFGAIDLILGLDGVYWFLECNPNGQWAWIENRTGLQIAAAIVDELQRIAST